VFATTPIFTGAPVLCGHRGSGAGDGENTLGSFTAALAAGLPWVEVDARLNAGGDLVARHEPAVDDGRFVADLDGTETDALGLLRVADLLAALPPDAGLDVEIKTSVEDALRGRAETTAARVADLLAAAPAGGPRLVTSFDPAALLIVRERLPAVPLGLLTWTRFPLRKAIPAAVHLGIEVVAAHYGAFPLAGSDREQVERPLARTVEIAHTAGLEVMAWCPPPAEAAELAAAGVDCLVVDRCGRS
jgi:glycerophosphoryl diester phosphodiesterase